ncbi:N-acetylmuramoyl-L-alanine amidase [Erysipelotrichaceae bacterium RD49]|nr:N-acetylmuramoyl-L-alanine amidase [Erysipelotrichaceae bacterium RD49]
MAKNGSPKLKNPKMIAALYTIGLCVVSLVIYGTLFTRTYTPISAKDDPVAESDPNTTTSSNHSAADDDSITYKTYKDQHETVATVLLDAGHGGIDGGNVTNDVLEKDLNLSITNKVAQYLKELNPNIDVKVTRSTDETPWFEDELSDLNYRLEQQKTQNADYFFSIHCNAFGEDPTVEGMVFFVNPTDTVMKDLVNKIGDNLTAVGWTQNYNVIDYELLQLVSMSDIHSSLVELGYMTNEFDFQKLTDPTEQDKAAKAIAAAISDYIMENPDAPDYVKPSEQNSEVSNAPHASIDSYAAQQAQQSQQAADPNASQNPEAAQDPNTQPAQ